MPKGTIKIDGKLLKRFREIARILGISLAECLERVLEDRVREFDLENGGLQLIAQQFIADTGYRSRERAEEIAERFEVLRHRGETEWETYRDDCDRGRAGRRRLLER